MIATRPLPGGFTATMVSRCPVSGSTCPKSCTATTRSRCIGILKKALSDPAGYEHRGELAHRIEVAERGADTWTG